MSESIPIDGFRLVSPELKYVADVVVYRVGKYAVAKDKYGNLIAQGEDHGEVIQKAINSIKYGTIFISSGQYYISSTINPKSNIRIVGSGVSTELIMINANVHMFENSPNNDIYNFTIENIVLNGSGSNYNAFSFGFGVQKQRLRFSKLTIKKFNTGIWINGNPPPRFVVIDNVYIHDCTKYGIASYYYEDVSIRNAVIENIGLEAIHMTGNNTITPHYISKRLRIDNVIIINPGNIGIDVSYVDSPIITRFYIYGAKEKAINGEPLSDLDHVDFPNGDRAVIENGVISNCPGCALYFTYGYRTTVKNVFIYNVGYNYKGTTDARRHGILFGVEEGMIDHVVVVNAAGDGIAMNANSKKTTVINPIVIGSGENGISMYNVNNITIINPYIANNSQLTANTYDGVHIYGGLGSYFIVILGGRIEDTQSTKTQRYGIYETSSASVFDGNDKFIGITILPQATGRVSISGKTSKIIECPGYTTRNSGTATFTGDGTTTQFKIAHGLVSAPNVVVVTPKGSTPAPSSIDWDATYIYINYSTAPASGTTLTFSWIAEV